MPKYCSVPHCRTAPGDRKSFYKFPLHDPERLHLWLRNMGRDNWTPSRHQYICHEHFAPSNFKVRWGIRYLENNAVPTLFQKEKVTEESERRTKRFHTNDNQSMKVSGGGGTEAVEAPLASCLQSVPKYKFAVDLSQLCQSGDHDPSHHTGLNPLTAEGNFPLTLLQTVEDFSVSGDNTEMALTSGDQAEVNGFTSGLTEVQEMVLDQATLSDTGEASLWLDVICTAEDFSNVNEDDQTQDIAYFQVVPSVFSGLTFSPETVLSSALSSEPITSTLPIVSTHVQSSESVKSMDTEDEDDDDARMENSSVENQQLEHCYHKSSLSKEQLEVIVAELEKKVKTLQQRHRRNLDKLLGLEKMVVQLSQSNLLYEERLQLLERAYLQTNVAIPDPGEIVTIIYEDDSSEYFCTPLNVPEEKL